MTGLIVGRPGVGELLLILGTLLVPIAIVLVVTWLVRVAPTGDET